MIKVYGASDNLVEVEGDIVEEFNPDYGSEDTPSYVGFSDGTLLSITYTSDGLWRISPMVKGECFGEIIQCPADDDDNYSDVALLDTSIIKITWVLFGSQFCLRRALVGHPVS